MVVYELDDLQRMKGGELRDLCKQLRLSARGSKAVMIQRILNPDDHRVIVGDITLHPTSRMTIDIVRHVPAVFDSLGPPTRFSVFQWCDELKVDHGLASHIFAICSKLTHNVKLTEESIDGTLPNKKTATRRGKKRKACVSVGRGKNRQAVVTTGATEPDRDVPYSSIDAVETSITSDCLNGAVYDEMVGQSFDSMFGSSPNNTEIFNEEVI